MITANCTVYELRQDTLCPGARDAFVRLFETELLDTQDAAGMRVLGQFRDVDRPDVFVWMRGFADMERRREALTAFYGGPVWAAYRDAANAMMIDSDDVLLLESADATDGLAAHVAPRPPLGATASGAGGIEVVVCPLAAEDTGDCLRRTEHLRRRAGGSALPALQSLHAPNTFPGLPVREDGHFVVSLTRYPDPATAGRLRTKPAARAAVDELDALATGPVQRLRLVPTARSALR